MILILLLLLLMMMMMLLRTRLLVCIYYSLLLRVALILSTCLVYVVTSHISRRVHIKTVLKKFRKFASWPSDTNTARIFQLLLRGYETIDKVGQLLWAWFSRHRKSADKIVEPGHMANFIVCNFVRYQLASRIHNSRIQVAKWYLHDFLCI